MKIKTIITSFLFLSLPTLGAPLAGQLSALAQAEKQGRAEEQAISDAKQAQDRADQQQRRQKFIELEKREKIKQANLAASKAQAKKRNEAYEDELRDIEIQSRKLELEREMTRVKRENDFIDAELKDKAARTDTIKSQADSNRNVSEGARDYMKSKGKAEEKKSGSWFD